MPAKAGIQVKLYQTFWIPAFAGMTDWIAENPQTIHLNGWFDAPFQSIILEKARS